MRSHAKNLVQIKIEGAPAVNYYSGTAGAPSGARVFDFGRLSSKVPHVRSSVKRNIINDDLVLFCHSAYA